MAVQVEWSESEYGTGVDVADKEHQKLFDIINRLSVAKHENLLSPSDKSLQRLKALFEELKEYAVYHFDHEERLFVATSYPNTAAHVASHRKFVAKLEEAEQAFHQTNQFPQKMFDFLVKWLGVHIKSMDREYAHYLGPSQDAGLSGMFFLAMRAVVLQQGGTERHFQAALEKVQSTWHKTPASSTPSNGAFITDVASLTRFEATRRYPELLFYQMLERLARTFKTPEADLLQLAGAYFIKTASAQHRQLLGTRFPDAIRHIDRVHNMVKSLPAFAQICPPTLRLGDTVKTDAAATDSSDNTTHESSTSSSSSTSLRRTTYVYYLPARHSRIPLLPVAIGALKELALYCGITDAVVTVPSLTPNINKEYELVIQWTAKRSSDGQSLDDDDDDSSDTLSGSFKSATRVRFEPDAVSKLYPFHLALRKDGRVYQVGPSLSKLVPSLRRSRDPNQSIAVLRPLSCSGPLVISKILTHLHELFWLSVRSTKTGTSVPLVVTMRGQFLTADRASRRHKRPGHGDGHEILVFCGDPLFTDLEAAQACGLDVADFALNSDVYSLLAVPGNLMAPPASFDGSQPPRSSSPPPPPLGDITPSKSAELTSKSVDITTTKTRKTLLGLHIGHKSSSSSSSSSASVPRIPDAMRCPMSMALEAGDLSGAHNVELVNANAALGPTPISVLSDYLFRDRFVQFALSSALLRLSGQLSNGAACSEALLTFYSVVGGVVDFVQSLLEREFRGGPETLLRIDTPAIRATIAFFGRTGDAWRAETSTAMALLVAAQEKSSTPFNAQTAALHCLRNLCDRVKRLPAPVGHVLQWVHGKTLAYFQNDVLADQALVNLLFLRFLLPHFSLQTDADAKNCLQVAKVIQQSAASPVSSAPPPPGIDSDPATAVRAVLNQIISVVLAEPYGSWEQMPPESPAKFGASLGNIRDFLLANYEVANEDFDVRPCLAEIGRVALARSVLQR